MLNYGIGPVIEGGFYYDIDLEAARTNFADDFAKIEKEMKKIINENIEIERMKYLVMKHISLLKKLAMNTN